MCNKYSSFESLVGFLVKCLEKVFQDLFKKTSNLNSLHLWQHKSIIFLQKKGFKKIIVSTPGPPTTAKAIALSFAVTVITIMTIHSIIVDINDSHGDGYIVASIFIIVIIIINQSLIVADVF